MKLNTLFSSLFEEAGLKDKIAEEKYKPLFTNETDIDEEDANALRSLMGFDTAKNNSKLKAAFIGEFTGIGERSLSALVAESGFTDEEVAEVNKNFKYLDKVEAYAKILKRKSSETPGKKTDEIVQKYNEAVKELDTIRKNTVAKEEYEKLQKTIESDRFNSAFEKVVNSIQWSDVYDEEARGLLLKAGLDKKIAELKAVAVLKDGKIQLKQAEHPELDYLDGSNKLLSFDKLAQDYALEKKFIAVSTSASTLPTQGTKIPETENKPKSQATDAFSNNIKESLKQFNVVK